jgi:hypothetical protein
VIERFEANVLALQHWDVCCHRFHYAMRSRPIATARRLRQNDFGWRSSSAVRTDAREKLGFSRGGTWAAKEPHPQEEREESLRVSR